MQGANGDTHLITTDAALDARYDQPGWVAQAKETDRIIAPYRAFIEASPFCVLATNGARGLDCSPRGEAPGFVRIADETTLLIPDRRGNNRIDSLRNIVRDPRVSLLFLIPGCGETLRIIGRAVISADPALLESFALNGAAPRTVLVVTVERVFYQCASAINRAQLWNPARHIERTSLPSTNAILAAIQWNGLKRKVGAGRSSAHAPAEPAG